MAEKKHPGCGCGSRQTIPGGEGMRGVLEQMLGMSGTLDVGGQAAPEQLASVANVLLDNRPEFHVGDLIMWAMPELMNKKFPAVGEPVLVTAVLPNHTGMHESMNECINEGVPLRTADLCCLVRIPNGQFEEYYFDSRRMVPWTPPAAAPEAVDPVDDAPPPPDPDGEDTLH